MQRRVRVRRYTSPETPTCEVPSNGVVEIAYCLSVLVKLRFRLGPATQKPLVYTLHCALEDGADLHVNERQRIRHYRASLLKNNYEEEECQMESFYFARCVSKLALYSDVIHLFEWKSAVEHDIGV